MTGPRKGYLEPLGCRLAMWGKSGDTGPQSLSKTPWPTLKERSQERPHLKTTFSPGIMGPCCCDRGWLHILIWFSFVLHLGTFLGKNFFLLTHLVFWKFSSHSLPLFTFSVLCWALIDWENLCVWTLSLCCPSEISVTRLFKCIFFLFSENFWVSKYF